MPAITLRNITKRFRKVVALKNVSFDVKEGEFFTIVGPTNAGKTTTLRVVAGLEKPNEGEVIFDGQPMNRVPPNLRDVALMFQNLALYPHRSGFDNIAFPLRVKKLAPDEVQRRVREVAGFLKITHLLERLPGTYSGGERQRLAFARTMVRDPALYMLDEPLANLDALIRLQMRVELRRIHQELGKTMIYVTHDQVEAMSMSNRIAVLHQGVIQQIGSPDDIYMCPANQFVAGFFGAPPMNFIPTQIERSVGYAVLKWGEYSVIGSSLIKKVKRRAASRGFILGIRPEDISILPDNGLNDSLRGRVVSLEQLGLKTIIDVELGSAVVRIAVPATFDYKVRDRCRITMKVERGHLFDPETGANLTIA
ncbi:MAG: ABC transporter ATP-binding protein [Desulfobacterales bacterium]|nr:MAG: ABC transporter ATP-binding protein [Desulfobacterales bacterium]